MNQLLEILSCIVGNFIEGEIKINIIPQQPTLTLKMDGGHTMPAFQVTTEEYSPVDKASPNEITHNEDTSL